MFALLIGVGALFLAVFVGAILDPRWSQIGGAGDNTRGDGESDYRVGDIRSRRIVRLWSWGALRPTTAQPGSAFTAPGASVGCPVAA